MSDADKTRDEILAELRELRAFRDRTRARQRIPGSLSAVLGRELVIDSYRDLMNTMGAVVFVIDEKGRLEASSDSTLHALGYEASELQGRELQEILHPEDRGFMDELRFGPERDRPSLDRPLRVRNSTGDWRTMSIRVMRRSLSDGRRLAMLFARDVTTVLATEAALDASETRYRALVDNATDLIVEIDERGTMLYVSPSSVDMLGQKPADLIGKTVSEMAMGDRLHPQDLSALFEALQPRLEDGARWRWRYRIRVGGEQRTYEMTGRTYRASADEIHAVLTSRDITTLVSTQIELEEMEKRYALLGRTSRDVITETGPDHRFLYVSPSVKQVLGYEPEELIGTLGVDTIHPDDVERVRSDFWESAGDPGVTFTPPYRCRAKDGSYRWFEGSAVAFHRADGSGPHVIGLLRDIHERTIVRAEQRALEERAQRSQRLEGLGVLAGGIAHDFNNLLTPILGQASLAMKEVDDSSELHQRLQKICTAARHAARLTNQMLAYAGSGELVLEAVDLSQLVRELSQLLLSGAQNTSIHLDLDEDLAPIQADAAQISQIAMNLITNAIEAVAEDGGAITLRTSICSGRDVARSQLVVGEIDDARNYAALEVSDDGVGMDEPTRDRIFDPFFTTKFTGRGLGLAATLGVVDAHDGAICLRSTQRQGTSFRVYLPLTPGVRRAKAAARPAQRWTAEGLVLVVDDDEGVRDLASDTLRRCGLEVVTAADGMEALELLRRRRGELRVVLLDRTMPVMSGDEVLARMREIAPEVPVVLVSGYTEENAASELAERGLDGFLNKPFLPEALVEIVRKVLDRSER